MSTDAVIDVEPMPPAPDAEVRIARLVPPVSDALVLQRDPNDVLAEASRAAKALMTVMASKPDKVMMNGQQYIENEDWQTIGHFYGVTAKIESDHFVEFGTVQGWEATAVLVSRDGRELGRATAMCLNDEEKWSSRAKYEWHYVMKDGSILSEEAARAKGNSAMVWEETSEKKPDGSLKSKPKKQKVEVGITAVPMFQLRSMAQTRASSKVHRTVLAFVPVLAGYSATPAEEMPQAERVPNQASVSPSTATASPVQSPAGTANVAEVGASVPNVPDSGQHAPAGYHYIHGYQKQGEWHEFSLLDWDQQGGSFKFSTKRDVIGDVVRQASDAGVPIKVTDFTAKKNTKHEGYVNKVETYKAPLTDAELDAELVKKEMARQAGEVA